MAHLGDTALFADLKTYGDLYPVGLALIPAGGHFTMGPREAAKAAVYLKAKAAAPMR